MSISNKLLVGFFLEVGCKQEDGEVDIRWRPINFDIYSDLFMGMINEACEEWLSNNVMSANVCYEVLFAHRIERNGAVVSAEYFEPIFTEWEII